MGFVRSFVAALLASGLGSGLAGAQNYPSQTIKLVVPFSAGGPVDALGRVFAQHLQTRLGQNIIIENRTGGGTSIGVKSVASAPPDGHTLLIVGPNVAYYPALFPDRKVLSQAVWRTVADGAATLRQNRSARPLAVEDDSGRAADEAFA